MKDVKDRQKSVIKHDGTKCLVCGEKFQDPIRASYCPKDIAIFFIPENKGHD